MFSLSRTFGIGREEPRADTYAVSNAAIGREESRAAVSNARIGREDPRPDRSPGVSNASHQNPV